MQENEWYKKIYDELLSLNHVQEKICNSLSVLARREVELRISNILQSNDEITVYQLSDGERSSREISKYVNLSHTTITKLWRKWQSEFEIVTRTESSKPFCAKFSLEELALLFGYQEIPDSLEPENGE